MFARKELEVLLHWCNSGVNLICVVSVIAKEGQQSTLQMAKRGRAGHLSKAGRSYPWQQLQSALINDHQRKVMFSGG